MISFWEVFLIIKDRNIKMKLIRYFVAKQWYPQIEVDVLYKEGVARTRKLITDVDVLGLYPSASGVLMPILGDCKTLKSQSPISRALWMKGLMDLLGASQGMVVLDKNIENDHKLAAHELKVSLLSDSNFEVYAKGMAPAYTTVKSAICIADNWDKYFETFQRFPNLEAIGNYIRSGFWNQKSASARLRHTLMNIRVSKPELNPENHLHVTLVTDIISLFAIAFSEITLTIFNQYLIPTTKEQLSDELKVLIYGGVENYAFWLKLRRNIDESDSDLTLPEWNTFLQIFRECLVQPISTNIIPLLLKEVAFEFCSEPSTKTELTYSKHLALKDPYAMKYSMLLTDYVCKAAKLPPEFSMIINKRLFELQN